MKLKLKLKLIGLAVVTRGLAQVGRFYTLRAPPPFRVLSHWVKKPSNGADFSNRDWLFPMVFSPNSNGADFSNRDWLFPMVFSPNSNGADFSNRDWLFPMVFSPNSLSPLLCGGGGGLCRCLALAMMAAHSGGGVDGEG